MKKTMFAAAAGAVLIMSCFASVFATGTASASEQTSKDSTAAASAELSLSSPDAQAKSENASASAAYPTRITLGQWRSGTLSYGSYNHYYSFTLSKAGYVGFTVANNYYNNYYEEPEWEYIITDSRGRKVADVDTPERVYSTTKKIGLAAGTYKVRVAADDDSFGRQYKFRVAFTASNYWEKEPNESIATANPISLNTNYYGSSDGYYSIALPRSGNIKINVTADRGGEFEVDVYNANRGLVKRIRNYNASFNSGNINLAAGTYYIAMDPDDVGYRFSVSGQVLPAPANVKIVNRNAYSLRVQWNNVSGATAYEVWRSTSYGGTYTKVATVSGRNYYINSGLQVARPYYYKIRAKVGNSVGSYSKYVGGRTLPITQSAISTTKNNTTSATVKWAKSSGATGYEVWRSTSYGGTYTRVAAVSGISRVDSGLKSGQAYYYKVRAYTTYGGVRHYGRFTTVRGVRM